MLKKCVLTLAIVLQAQFLCAQASGLTPAQEAWLRTVYMSRTGIYDQAAINAAKYTNWYSIWSNEIHGLFSYAVTNAYAYDGATNAVAVTGHIAYITFGTNFDTWASNAIVNAGSGNPKSGIWAMNHSRQLCLRSEIDEPAAGYYKMDTNGDIIVSTNYWLDSWWTTNSSGQITARNLP